MSFNCLGGMCFDDVMWHAINGADSDISATGISLSDEGGVGATEASVRGSRYGNSFQALEEHTNRSDEFITRTEDFISYYCWGKMGYTVEADGTQSFITSHFDGDAAPDGAVRIVFNMDNGTTIPPDAIDNFHAALQYSDGGGTWVNVTEAGGIDFPYTSLDCWALQVDMTNGDLGACEARIMHYDEDGACPNGAVGGAGNGTWHEELTWTSLGAGNAKNAGVLATPALGFKQVGGKGVSNIPMAMSCYWVYEATAAADLPEHEDGSGNFYEVWGTYCNADDTVGAWAATGGPASCSDLWRVLCNPEEPDTTTNGYISEASGAEQIYLGEVADIGAANGSEMATLDGVGVTAISSGAFVDDLGLKHAASATDWKVGEIGKAVTNKFAFWDKRPTAGTAWAVGDLATLLAGVKVDAATAGKCYGIIIHLVGSGGRRPTNDLVACPLAPNKIYQVEQAVNRAGTY